MTTNPQVPWLIENREKVFRFAFLLQFVAAVPFLALGYITGKIPAHLMWNGKPAPGFVVNVVPVHQSGGDSFGNFYSRKTGREVIIEFFPGVEPVRFREARGSSLEIVRGSPVDVIYDPANPEIAMRDRGYKNYLPWAPCAAIGTFLFFVALKGLFRVLFAQAPSASLVQD